MKETIEDRKSCLRREFIRQRTGIDLDKKKLADAAICRHLLAAPQIIAAETVIAFYPWKDEPDLRPLYRKLLADGKRCLFPKSESATSYVLAPVSREDFESQFENGRFGIPEPVSNPVDLKVFQNQTILWLVPGLAVDLCGRRLGRGGGFYDRLLAAAPGLKIASIYQIQVAESIPVNERDINVHGLVTEQGFRLFNQAGG